MSSEIGDIIGYATIAIAGIALVLIMIPAIIFCTIEAERELREWKQERMELKEHKQRKREEKARLKERIKKFK